MPRGIPKTKHEPAAGTEEQGNGATGATGQENKTTKAAGRKKGKRVNKLQCVREAIAELGNDAQPKDIQDFLKRRFNLDMNTKFISTYKGTILRSAARESGVIREPAAAVPPAESVAVPPRESVAVAARNGGLSVEDIRVIKELVDRIGAGPLKELAEVLSE